MYRILLRDGATTLAGYPLKEQNRIDGRSRYLASRGPESGVRNTPTPNPSGDFAEGRLKLYSRCSAPRTVLVAGSNGQPCANVPPPTAPIRMILPARSKGIGRPSSRSQAISTTTGNEIPVVRTEQLVPAGGRPNDRTAAQARHPDAVSLTYQSAILPVVVFYFYYSRSFALTPS